MKVMGMISGTSYDGIDVAVVDFHDHGELLTAEVSSFASVPYPSELKSRIAAVLPPAAISFAEAAQLDTLIGQAFAAAAVAQLGGGVELIASHGQTVYHWTEQNRVLGTLQIGQPAWIAEATGVPVVADLRVRDITVGGQGAPLASTLDHLLLAERAAAGQPVAALNLGGISNVTVVGDRAPRAWDIGPANALLDAVVQSRGLHEAGFDVGGELAARGKVDAALLAELLREPYYQLPAPKSTGKELFHLRYLAEQLRRCGREDIASVDLLATLSALTVRTVVEALQPLKLAELYVSGGGVHHRVVMAGLARMLAGTSVMRVDELGIGADEKEAVLMALLGWLSWHGAPGALPSATGASATRILGAFTPGADPLQLPAPRYAPQRLRVLGKDHAQATSGSYEEQQ